MIKEKGIKRNFKTKRVRKKFLEVDVWQKQFGIVSVKAIFDIYSQKFKDDEGKKISFSHCVNSLRKLEDPNYKVPKDTI